MTNLLLVSRYFLFLSTVRVVYPLTAPPPCSRSMSTTTHTLVYTIPASDHRFVRVGETTPVLWRCRPIQTTSQKDPAQMPPSLRPQGLRFEIGRGCCLVLKARRYRQLSVSISLEITFGKKRGGFSRTRRRPPVVSVTHLDSGCRCPHS